MKTPVGVRWGSASGEDERSLATRSHGRWPLPSDGANPGPPCSLLTCHSAQTEGFRARLGLSQDRHSQKPPLLMSTTVRSRPTCTLLPNKQGHSRRSWKETPFQDKQLHCVSDTTGPTSNQQTREETRRGRAAAGSRRGPAALTARCRSPPTSACVLSLGGAEAGFCWAAGAAHARRDRRQTSRY